MKPKLFALLCLFFLILPLGAQQLTTVGIVDVGKVTTAFFRDSQAVRELEDMTVKLQAEIDGISAEINGLKEQKLQAENIGNRNLALQLDEEIYNKTNYLRDYYRIKNNQLQERRNRLTESASFLTELQKAIAFVAEDQGYNVILKSSDPNLLWWSKQVDITELIIQRLLLSGRR
jgi:outer membrane protein